MKKLVLIFMFVIVLMSHFVQGSPVAWWKMDELTGSTVFSDSTGNGHTGELKNASGFVPGHMGNGLCLMNNSSVTVPDSDSLEPESNQLYIDLWFNLLESKRINTLISKWGSYYLRIVQEAGASPYIQLGLFSTDGAENDINATCTINRGIWYHLVCSYDGAKALIYLNGNLLRSGSVGKTLNTSSSRNLILGGPDWLDPAEMFTGVIDAVKIYKASTATSNSLIADWEMDETSGTAISDNSGHGNNGMLILQGTKFTAGFTSIGLSEQGLCLADYSYVQIPDNDSLEPSRNEMCIDLWFNQTENGSINTLVSKWSSYYLRIMGTSEIQFGLFANKDGAIEENVVSAACSINLGTWYHLVASYDGTIANIYLNDTLIASRTLGITLNTTSTRELMLGTPDWLWLATIKEYFTGIINKVRIYNSATPSSNSLMADWEMNETSGTTIFDSSGNGNNGIVFISPLGKGQWGSNSLSLSNSGYAVIPYSSQFISSGNKICIDIWLNPASSDNEVHTLVYKAGSYDLHLVGLNTLKFGIYYDEEMEYAAGSYSFTAGTWYHVKGVYDGTKAKIYVNDTLLVSRYLGFGLNSETTDLNLGSEGTTHCFNGQLGEVKIYNNGGVTGAPTFTPEEVSISGQTTVAITSETPGAIIYYTTDGSTPTSDSTRYTGAMTVSEGTVLKAIAVADGYDESKVSNTVQYLYTGSSAMLWESWIELTRAKEVYNLFDIGYSAADGAMEWTFNDKVSQSPTTIYYRKIPDAPFDRMVVTMRNLGSTDAVIGFQLMTLLKADQFYTSVGSWTSNETCTLSADGNWHELSFSWNDLPELPIPVPYPNCTALILQVHDPIQNTPYTLQVRNIKIISDPISKIMIDKFSFPSTVSAGDSISLPACSFTAEAVQRSSVSEIQIKKQSKLVSRIPLMMEEGWNLQTGTMTIPDQIINIPRFIEGGEAEVWLVLGESRIKCRTVTITPREVGSVEARVETYHGVPTLFINGTPMNGMAHATYKPSQALYSLFQNTGVELFNFTGTPTDGDNCISLATWLAPDVYDYSHFDERVNLILEKNPNAYIFPRINLQTPIWWGLSHPNDLILSQSEEGVNYLLKDTAQRPVASWASESWRADTLEGIRRLVAHVEASPYADRIIGYMITSGCTEEWMMWGSNDSEWVDYSPVNTAKFQSYLQDKYLNQTSLQSLWSSLDIGFSTAAIPSRASRETTGYGSLRNPASEQSVIDFYQYNSFLVADTISYFAENLKEITDHKKIVGLFYGYLLQLCGNQRQQNAGHLALKKVLNDPNIDLLCSPTSYMFRQVGGEGTSHFMSLYSSVALHGKLWLDENDIRTSLTPDIDVGVYGKPATVAEDILQQEKELANVLTSGVAQWWFDAGSVRFDNDSLISRITQLTANATEVMKLDRSPVDEIAFVVDEDSLNYLKVGDYLGYELLVGRIPELSRLGAPIGYYLADDLANLKKAKMIIFATSFAPSEEQRQLVDELKGDGRILVFLYAPGIYKDGVWNPDAMQSFTGINLSVSLSPQKGYLQLSDNTDWLGDAANTTAGIGEVLNPYVTVNDSQAISLGRFGNNQVGLAVRVYDDWTAVFSSIPQIPQSLFIQLAEKAKVHRYIETKDVVWANADMVSVCVYAAGTRTIQLPEKRKVRELYTSTVISSEPVKNFEWNFASKGTNIFILESSKIPGDANSDGCVDVGDLGIMAANYGMIGGATWAKGDFNGDGAVDVGDLGILAANYGTGTSGADFDADYVKNFGTTSADKTENNSEKVQDSTNTDFGCQSLGIPLLVGIFLVGLMLSRLRLKE